MSTDLQPPHRHWKKHGRHIVFLQGTVQGQDRLRHRRRQRHQSRHRQEFCRAGCEHRHLRAHAGETRHRRRRTARRSAPKSARWQPTFAIIAALEAAFARSKQELGPMHVLVAGAAGKFPVPAEKLSANGFRTVIEIDLIGAFHASRAAFEQLKETQGTILFISAGMAYVPHAYQAHVGAAKAGIDMLMRNLALEWGRHGIRANSIVPGPIGGTEGMKRLLTPDRRKNSSTAYRCDAWVRWMTSGRWRPSWPRLSLPMSRAASSSATVGRTSRDRRCSTTNMAQILRAQKG